MNDFYVYAWTRPDTGSVFYIGKGSGRRDVEKKRHNPHFLRIMEKLKRLGLTPSVSRLAENLTEQEAFDIERAEIARYGRSSAGGTLCNQTDGGDGSSGATMSQQARAKISMANSNPSAERRARMSESQRGRIVSPEHRAKLSAAHTGVPLSAQHRAKVAAAGLGRIVSKETRAKISASNTGKTLSNEARAKIGAIHRGKVMSPESRARMSGDRRLRGPYKGDFKGVFFCSRSHKWQARITLGGKAKGLGCFPTAEDAARAYDAAAFNAWGADCYFNFPEQRIAACPQEV